MLTSSAKFTAPFRIPLIKFIGARLPRPNFAGVVTGPIPSPPPPAVSAGKVSTGAVGQTTRVLGISEDELPPYLRRPLIDQEECDAINAGGAYGLKD